jgi:D-aminopeptidase
MSVLRRWIEGEAAWGTPGRWNAITDVPGVRVGHATVASSGPHCTGVTAILPHEGDLYREKTHAAATVINGYGKMTGLAQVAELGTLETPILLTNTLAVGTVWDACVRWMLERYDRDDDPLLSINPVVGECNDGKLSEIRARAVTVGHALEALNRAADGAVTEGCVGAGTGMVAFGWKSGVGTASRVVEIDGVMVTVGALVLPNYGSADQLTVLGVPVGRRIPPPPALDGSGGSIILVLATDLPCSDRQLARLSRRAAAAIARVGGTGDGTSGEFALAFTTENRLPESGPGILEEARIDDRSDRLDGVFRAAVEASEEAILSALFAATPMHGRDGRYCPSIPKESVVALLRDRGVGTVRRA